MPRNYIYLLSLDLGYAVTSLLLAFNESSVIPISIYSNNEAPRDQIVLKWEKSHSEGMG